MVQPYKAGGTHQGAVERGGASGVGEPAAGVGSSRSRWGLGQSGGGGDAPARNLDPLKFVTVPSFVDSVPSAVRGDQMAVLPCTCIVAAQARPNGPHASKPAQTKQQEKIPI